MKNEGKKNRRLKPNSALTLSIVFLSSSSWIFFVAFPPFCRVHFIFDVFDFASWCCLSLSLTLSSSTSSFARFIFFSATPSASSLPLFAPFVLCCLLSQRASSEPKPLTATVHTQQSNRQNIHPTHETSMNTQHIAHRSQVVFLCVRALLSRKSHPICITIHNRIFIRWCLSDIHVHVNELKYRQLIVKQNRSNWIQLFLYGKCCVCVFFLFFEMLSSPLLFRFLCIHIDIPAIKLHESLLKC